MIFPLALWIVGITGFVALSYEILWYRSISVATGSSPAAFGFLLGFYLAGLAVGAYGARLVCDARASRGDPRYLRHTAALVTAANVIGFLVLPALAWLQTVDLGAVTFGLIALSAAMFGAVLPLVSHFGIAPTRAAGTQLSYLYVANIVGSVLGSFLTGFVLVEVLSVEQTALALVFLGAVVVIALLWMAGIRPRSLLRATAGLAALVLLCAFASSRLFNGFYSSLILRQRTPDRERFSDVVENRHGVIAITKLGTIYGNGAYDGRLSTGLMEDPNQITRAYAVAAMHPAPRRVLMIGLSGGAWAQVIANNPVVNSILAIDINPGYLQVIARHPQVSSVLANPKLRIVIDDGRRWLSRHPGERFDMIVANTTQHWRANSTNLLSIEYVRLIAAHLKPGGIYYFNTTNSRTAIKTAMSAFPYGWRFRNFAAVGPDSFAFDRGRWQESLRTYRIDGQSVFDLTKPEARRRLTEVVSDTAVESRESVLKRLGKIETTTDDNMLPEWFPDR